jgi:hypothetical protein
MIVRFRRCKPSKMIILTLFIVKRRMGSTFLHMPSMHSEGRILPACKHKRIHVMYSMNLHDVTCERYMMVISLQGHVAR